MFLGVAYFAPGTRPKRRWKRAQTTRLASFGPWVFFFVFFFAVFFFFSKANYLGPHYFFQAPDELRWTATTITGPNDARCVVWALGMCFFFPRVFSLLNNDFYFDLGPHYVLKAPKELRWAATTITGPNDASGVVGALGMYFFLFFFVFSLTS